MIEEVCPSPSPSPEFSGVRRLANLIRQFRSLIALPILYAITVGLNALSILHHLPLLGWYEMPVMFPYIGAAILSVVTATLIQCAVVPLIEERIFNEEKFKQLSIEKARRRDSLRRISMSLSEKKELQALHKDAEKLQPAEIVNCETDSDKERKKKIRKDINILFPKTIVKT